MQTWKKFTELFVTKRLDLQGAEVSGNFRRSGVQMLRQAAPAAKAGATTLTAAELLGGLLTGNPGGAAGVNYQLPTGTSIEQALKAKFKAININDAFDFTLVNISTVAAEDITVTTNTGLTLVGGMVVASNAAATDISRGTFRVRRTAANTYSVYRIA